MKPHKITPWFAEVMDLEPSEAALEVAEALSETIEGYGLSVHIGHLQRRLPDTALVGFRELTERRCVKANCRGIYLVRRTQGVPGEPQIVRMLRESRGKGYLG